MRIVQYNGNPNVAYEFRLVIGDRLFRNKTDLYKWSNAIGKNWIAVEFSL